MEVSIPFCYLQWLIYFKPYNNVRRQNFSVYSRSSKSTFRNEYNSYKTKLDYHFNRIECYGIESLINRFQLVFFVQSPIVSLYRFFFVRARTFRLSFIVLLTNRQNKRPIECLKKLRVYRTHKSNAPKIAIGSRSHFISRNPHSVSKDPAWEAPTWTPEGVGVIYDPR